MPLEAPLRHERTYPPEDADTRRALVKRIVASPSFSKSRRLSEFLKYVCALGEKGRFDDIHEQNIGSAVFGRIKDYDPGVDSIVRSHATRLRHKLKEYFDGVGRHEPLIITIPRGSYIPSFDPRPFPLISLQEAAFRPQGEEGGQLSRTDAMNAPSTGGSPSANFPAAQQGFMEPGNARTGRLRMTLALSGFVVALLVLGFLLRAPAASSGRLEDSARHHPLWANFLSGKSVKTLLVASDSGLVMYEHLTQQPVSLGSYMSGEYLKQTSSQTVPEDIVRKFGTRRYTPALDLEVLDRMTRIFHEDRERLSFRYSRDVRMEDLKQGNAILLGTTESDPWVQLFEPSMNFFFQDDLLRDKARMLNRHPQPGELPYYDSTPQDPAPTVFGVVAYRRNIQSSGRVLILEGQTMAGTQSAADFVFDDSYLLPFLNKIKMPDGTVPYFELLLRSRSFVGQSSHIDVIAYRIDKD